MLQQAMLSDVSLQSIDNWFQLTKWSPRHWIIELLNDYANHHLDFFL